MERKCIVCEHDNPNPRSMFCCNKCKQQYYYQKNKEQRTEYKKQYYQDHKKEYDQRRHDWTTNNREKWNEYMKNYKKLKKDKEAKEDEQ